MDKGYGKDFFENSGLNFEKVLCEIIDNSMDNPVGNQKVKVDLIIEEENAQSKQANSFRVYIYDDANGFENENKLHASFELTHPSLQPHAVKKVGKFFYGMKVAPLTKFEHFSLVTEIEGKYLIRSTRYPGIENKTPYQWKSTGVLGTNLDNPSDSAPSHLGIEGITKIMKRYSYKTCAIMSCPRVALTKKPHGKTDLLYYNELMSHLSSFLGIVYGDCISQKRLELKIGKNITSLDEIKPTDPFWSEFTPSNMKTLALTETNKDRKEMLETVAPHAILAGNTSVQKIVIDSKECEIKITPYILPKDIVLKMIHDKYEHNTPAGNKLYRYQKVGKKQKQMSKHMRGEEQRGFYFYRGGRAIIFGTQGAENNKGMWHGIEGLPIAGWANQIRIKVEYDPGELDTLLRLDPNKNTYTEIDDKVWEVIRQGLIQTIDGKTLGHAKPYDEANHYWLEDASKGTIHAEQKTTLKACNKCKYIHVHIKYCPKGNCLKCNLPKSKNICTINKCNTKPVPSPPTPPVPSPPTPPVPTPPVPTPPTPPTHRDMGKLVTIPGQPLTWRRALLDYDNQEQCIDLIKTIIDEAKIDKDKIL
jgi:hypothetical protein